MIKQNNNLDSKRLDTKSIEKELLSRITVQTTDGDNVYSPDNPLPYSVRQTGIGMWVIKGRIGRFPDALLGTFTDELSAKVCIVRYWLKTHPPKKPKFKYKTVGRPTKFRRTSRTWQKLSK